MIVFAKEHIAECTRQDFISTAAWQDHVVSRRTATHAMELPRRRLRYLLFLLAANMVSYTVIYCSVH